MKSKDNLLERLKPLPHFGKVVVHQLGSELGLEKSTIDTYIRRFLQHREIYRLRNGLYVSSDTYERNRNDVSYSFYLANVIRTPSYISSWTALSYYNLTTEAIRTATSVTTKVTRSFRTRIGDFTYQSINKELFSGFSLMKGTFDYFIASPPKALFDLLYFKTYQFRGIREADVETIVAELRIDIDEMSTADQRAFHHLVKKYINE